ncbi:hypothetical protein FGO68_gene2468 [Halteria grandinella]|uniref:Uncharacterized protein n=1 Tax=Halteria grandinella TaxID=5974 RepID=A0A8J8NXE7_HALGN|nr:hypothetical protein FGO68_gene2468 [Halteria grandinella]
MNQLPPMANPADPTAANSQSLQYSRLQNPAISLYQAAQTRPLINPRTGQPIDPRFSGEIGGGGASSAADMLPLQQQSSSEIIRGYTQLMYQQQQQQQLSNAPGIPQHIFQPPSQVAHLNRLPPQQQPAPQFFLNSNTADAQHPLMSREHIKSRLEEENEVKMRMNELKRQLNYIDKTNWFFERETVDFAQFIPFEQDQQYVGASNNAKNYQQQSFQIGGGYQGKK